MKRGVFGGTFDPIHLGHLLVASDVAEALGLDEVLFVPAARPWMKRRGNQAPAEERLAMVELALEGDQRFVASRVDLDRAGPSYAVDTVRDLRREGSQDDDYYFIMGMDSLEALPSWREPQEFLSLCRLAVVERPGYRKERTVLRLKEALPEAIARVRFVQAANISLSSTDTRRRVREGRSTKYRVVDGVDRYIRERGLYR